MASADAYDYRRAQMVEALKRGGIDDQRVLDVMSVVPRHLFVPEALRHQAYSHAARIRPSDRVLEIGTGSGYQAAVLSHLAQFVFSVERVASLARQAKRVLDHLGIENVSVKVMDGTLGWRAQAPYDAILVTAGAPEVPAPLVDQLADGGRLVVPVGPRETQVLKVVRRRGERTVVNELKGACFVPLIGRHGWEDRSG